MADETWYKGVAKQVIHNGRHGPYGVATCEALDGSVTFSRGVWPEENWPEPGEVLMFQVRKKQAGWRAVKARYFVKSDEEQASSTQQRARSRS
jgi:hypothetical protein